MEECETPDDDKRSHCYVLWTPGENDVPNITLKGCFLNYEACYDQRYCVEKTPRRLTGQQHMFCCCEGDMCNKNFTWDPVPTTEAPPSSSESKGIIYHILNGAIHFIKLQKKNFK